MVKLDKEKIKNNIEAILFSYGDWISIEEIQNSLGLENQKPITSSLAKIQTKFKAIFCFTSTLCY